MRKTVESKVNFYFNRTESVPLICYTNGKRNEKHEISCFLSKTGTNTRTLGLYLRI